MMTLDIKDFILTSCSKIPEYIGQAERHPAIIIERYTACLPWPTPAVCCLSLLKNSLD
jgi:hypothetical protein